MVKNLQGPMTRAGITAKRHLPRRQRQRPRALRTNISAQATAPATSSARCSRCRARPGEHDERVLGAGLRSAPPAAAQWWGSTGLASPDRPVQRHGATLRSGWSRQWTCSPPTSRTVPPAASRWAPAPGPRRVHRGHETGHFLGPVPHHPEQEGADFDPLTDTAKCRAPVVRQPPDRPKNRTAESPSSASQPVADEQPCLSPGAGCGGGDNLDVWFLAARRPVGNITAPAGAGDAGSTGGASEKEAFVIAILIAALLATPRPPRGGPAPEAPRAAASRSSPTSRCRTASGTYPAPRFGRSAPRSGRRSDRGRAAAEAIIADNRSSLSTARPARGGQSPPVHGPGRGVWVETPCLSAIDASSCGAALGPSGLPLLGADRPDSRWPR